MTRTYISCADTTKLLRAALKKNFPATKFSVRSDTYAGGASIRVRWTDGPTEKMVSAVAGQFAGGRFDGMIDLAYSVAHWLMPDGSVAIASNPGTVENGGVDHPEREWMPDPSAKLVHFGADYVFCDRQYSERFVRQALARLVRHGHPQFAQCTVANSSWGARIVERLPHDDDLIFHRETQRLVIA